MYQHCHSPTNSKGNLIYLALMTERIPKFLSTHIDPSAPPFVFGEVFDVPRLNEVKDPESQVLDDLGYGWTVWETVQQHLEIPEPRQSPSLNLLKLVIKRLAITDVMWTRTSAWVKLISPSLFVSCITWVSRGSFENLDLSSTDYPSLQHQVSLPPDDHVLCFDFLYYISAHHTWEWELDYSPAWRFVGQHMRWTASMEKIADAHTRRAMNVPATETTPPASQIFGHGISINMRHDQCFAPLSVIARRVSEVQEELRTRKGIETTHVIMTSDERDPEWWSDVRALGWMWVNYAAEQTEEIYGKWHPVFIDAIIRSNGACVVGTRGSIMSTLASRRV
ncbi:uncharacterized protein F5147DRAFT_799170 [Suillus discolor]|uniref:Uncharacterized protein n=1 Tax=Suillus discolor TaxID=1912936 RepID=A0A9P7EQG1_9AGAM|nr:uncharacterized protein F5147DRAFT_799170 [Suillus discolor]KAG2083832.1 hypothetical protein F5147DRAFT_799170 [Suillus discolor]